MTKLTTTTTSGWHTIEDEGGRQGYIVALDADAGNATGSDQQLYSMEWGTCSGTMEIRIMGN